MWSHNIYDSISKSVQFQFTVSVVVVLCALVGSFIIKDSPLRDFQMLWIYLTMNILLTLSFAGEPPTEELLRHKSNGRTQSLISRTVIKNIIGHAIYQLTVILFILLVGK
jgi:Ca2+ transporting ATPase